MSEQPPNEEGATAPRRPRPAASLRTWLYSAGLLLAAAAVFWQVLGFDFADWDDDSNVFKNPFYHPPTLDHLLRFWKSGYYDLYMPVTYTVWWLCARLRLPMEPILSQTNTSAAVCHGANLAFHLVNVALVWMLLRLLLRRSGTGGRSDASTAPAAAVGALLFAVHPLQVESVSWVTGLNNVLSATFGLTALLLYLAGRTPGERLAARPGLASGMATFAFLLAILSKPTAVALPLIALALDWGTNPRGTGAADGRLSWRGALLPLSGWVLIALVDVIVTRRAAGIAADVYLPYWGRPFIAGDALAFYLFKLFAPFGLCVDYGRTPAMVLGSWWGYADAAAVAAVAVALWRSRDHALQTAALVSVAGLLPMLGFVPFYLHRWSTVGDRYVYLALIGPAFAVAAVWQRAGALPPRLRRLLAALCAAFAALLATLSAVQCATWRNDDAIFSHTLAVNSQSILAKFNLGAARMRQGDPDGAAALYAACVREAPDFAPSYYEFGTVLVRRGQIDQGIPYLREAIRLAPGYADAHNNLALALQRQGKWREAVAEFQAALDTDPSSGSVRQALAAAQAQAARDPNALRNTPPDADPAAARKNADGIRLAREGHTDDALLAFRQAIRERPDYAAAFYNLAVTLDHIGNLDGAAAAYRSALLRQPNYPEACLSLAVVLARQGDAAGALSQLNEALRLRPGWPVAQQALTALKNAAAAGKAP